MPRQKPANMFIDRLITARMMAGSFVFFNFSTENSNPTKKRRRISPIWANCSMNSMSLIIPL
jgi:hypothetical protein